jgi:kynureninase
MQALIHDGVIGDVRQPDLMRFGFAALYTRYVDIWNAVASLERILRNRTWARPEFARLPRVT